MPPKLSFVWCFPRILFSNWLLLITLCSCSLRMALVNEYLHFHFNLIWETLAFNWWKHELRFVLHTNLFGFVPTVLLCALFCLPFCFLSFFSLFVHNIGSHWFYWIYFSPFLLWKETTELWGQSVCRSYKSDFKCWPHHLLAVLSR